MVWLRLHAQNIDAFHVLRSYHSLRVHGVGSSSQCEPLSIDIALKVPHSMLLPMNYLQITISSNSGSIQELHARKSGLPKMLRPYVSKLAAVRSAQVYEGSTHGEEIVIQFWSAEDFRDLQKDASSPWHGITIDLERTCSRDIEAEIKRDIKTLITSAPKGNSGLHIQPGTPFFEFQGVCLVQLLPYVLFELKVENGQGGKCETGQCHGILYTGTKHGFLDEGTTAFYDTTEQEDLDEFIRRNNVLRGPH